MLKHLNSCMSLRSFAVMNLRKEKKRGVGKGVAKGEFIGGDS